jgi:hypothetical protein
MKNLVTRVGLSLLVIGLVSAAALGQMRSNKFGVGVSGSYFLLQADYTAKPSYGGGVDLSYSVTEYFRRQR